MSTHKVISFIRQTCESDGNHWIALCAGRPLEDARKFILRENP